jgi:DNA-binding MarR family transcriptional regulator
LGNQARKEMFRMTEAAHAHPPAAVGVESTLEAFRALVQALVKGDSGDWLESDLTMAQVRALFTVFRHGPLPVSGVAHHLSVGLPTASHLVDCLVRAGLVARHGDADDRRVVHCSVTEKGRALVDEAAGARSERMRALLSRLDGGTLEGLQRGLTALARAALVEEDASHAEA